MVIWLFPLFRCFVGVLTMRSSKCEKWRPCKCSTFAIDCHACCICFPLAYHSNSHSCISCSHFRTLSGILRLSPRRSVLTLKVSLHPLYTLSRLIANFQDRFIRLLKKSHIPDRNDVNYNKGIRQRHAAILGICALVESYPYTVEKWLPELLMGVLAEHSYDPVGPFLKHLRCPTHWIGFSRSQFRTQWENAQVTLRERIKTPGTRTRSALTKNNSPRSRLCCLVPPTVCCYFDLICVLSMTWSIDAWILGNDRGWNRQDYKHKYALDFVITVTLNRLC